MIQKVISKLKSSRKFWRDIRYDQMSRIYLALTLRGLATSLTGVFVPLFLLKLGYSFVEVATVIAVYYATRGLIMDYISGVLTNWLGSRKVLAISFIALAMSTFLFTTQPNMHWSIILLGAVWGAAMSLYAISVLTSVAAAHSFGQAGRAAGQVDALDKLTSLIAPLVGGIIATLFGGQYIFAIGLALFVIAGIPVWRAREDMPTRRKLHLKLFNWRRARRNMLAYNAYGIDLALGGGSILWSLYLAVFVLTPATAYLGMSVLSSVSVGASMLAALAIGRYIDKRSGRKMLRFGAVTNAILNIVKPLWMNYFWALGASAAQDVVRTAFKIPLIKGFYAEASEQPKQRTEYVTVMEISGSLTKMAAWIMVGVVAVVSGELIACFVGFGIASIASLLTMAEKYRALD